MQRAKSVDAFIEQSTQWREELTRLRDILRATSLQEELKWGAPCYTHNGKNVVGIGAFKADRNRPIDAPLKPLPLSFCDLCCVLNRRSQ